MKLTIKSLGKTFGLCAVLAGALAATMPASAATTLRIGTVLAPNDPMGQGLEKFKAEVEKATNGDVEIEVFHNSQLGDTTEMIDQARAGAAVGTVTDVARLSSFVPSLAIMSAPFLFDTYEQADKFALSDEYIAWGEELREKSGAGMMDCKKALSENGGDLEQAVDWLRTKGLAAAAKKAGRVAAEGLVAVAVDGNKGAVVEVNSETDFVSRNEQFQGFVSDIAGLALAADGDMDKLLAADFPGGKGTVADQLTDMIATIGENMTIRRCDALTVSNGVLATYVHNAMADGIGKIAVLVGLESDGDKGKLEAFGKQVAMHVAAAKPQAVSRDDLDPEILERERAVLSEQARESGKPEEIIEKMVEGRLRKFYEEVCLLDQTFVMDGETQVAKAVEAAGKDAGGAISINGFKIFVLGEGIEKEEGDFAAEVAAAAGS